MNVHQMSAHVCLNSSWSCSCDTVLFVVRYTGVFILLATLFDCIPQIRNKDVILSRGEICDIVGPDRCFAEKSSRWVKNASSDSFLQTFRDILSVQSSSIPLPAAQKPPEETTILI